MFIGWLAGAWAQEVCTAWQGEERVEVPDIPVEESSGVAAARSTPGLYYTHDDEEGAPSLYAFEFDGTFVGEQAIDGAVNVDWEDIAAGPCPDAVDAEDCLWIGDIGDNDEVRESVVVYVVPESTAARETAVACTLVYPEGKRWNAETLLVSPEGALRIVTKEADGEAHVFRVDAPVCDGSEQALQEEAELSLGSAITGGAMSQDGGMVVLRSLGEAWAWTGCTIDWGAEPASVDLGSQPQGEAVTFDADGSLVTTSEGQPFRAWRVPCTATEALECPSCGCGSSASAWLLFLPLVGWRTRRQQ